MANTINSGLIPNIIAAARDVLREKAALLSNLNPDFSTASAELGNVVNVPVPQALAAESVTVGVTPPSPTGLTLGTNALTINNFQRSKPFALTVQERQNYSLSSTFQRQIGEGVRAVVNAMATDVASNYVQIPSFVGTGGTGAFASNANSLADVDYQLNQQNVSPDNRWAFISNKDRQALLKTDDAMHFNLRGSDEVNRAGVLGTWFGINVSRDSFVPTHTAGTITTGLIAKASTAQAIGTTAVVCTTAASTGACALKAGDVISLDGYTYSLSADATQASAATDVTVNIYEGLKTALTGSEAVTLPTGFATGITNICGDMSGISLVTRLPDTGMPQMETRGRHIPVVDPDTGLAVLLSIYDLYHQTSVEVSAIWGSKVTDYRKLTRLLSYTS